MRDGDKFDLFFTKVIDLLLNELLTIEELPLYVSFFKYAFRVRIPSRRLSSSPSKWNPFASTCYRSAVFNCGIMFTRDAVTTS